MKHRTVIVASFVLLFAMAFSVGAESGRNLQKIYPVNSDVYQAIKTLYISQGLSLPSTTGPWSADELLKMLDRINRNRLAGGELETYDFAASQLESDTPTFKFSGKVAAEGYYHTNTASFTREKDWVMGYNERSPMLDLVLEAWPSENFYGYSSLSAANNCYNGWDSRGATSTLFGQSALTTNLWLVPPSVLKDLDFNFPFRAFGAAGGDGWSLEAGREKLSWGPGETGNFIIGDHLLYHNAGRLTTYGKNYKYTLLTSFFPHPSMYYPVMDNAGNVDNSGWQANLEKGLNMFLGHRLEWRMFGNKVGFALTEAIMYQSEDNTFDLRVLNPAAIFHNYYIRGNSNSILSVELDYTPINHLNLYGQVVVDEFPLPGEPVPGVDAGALPSAFGFMAGAKGSYPFAKGMIYGSAEWVKTDPYLYLRDNGSYTQALGDYGVNYVVAIRTFSNGSGITYSEDFLGYQYGGDAIVMNANIGYKQFGKWYVTGSFFNMVHGTHDKWTLWSQVDPSAGGSFVPNSTTPTTSHNTGNNGDLTANLRDAASVTTIIGVKAGYTVLKNLDVYGQADFISIKNPGNISTNPTISDIQISTGVSYKF